MQQGYSRQEAENLDPAERTAIRYAVAIQNGFRVNWETGEVEEPERDE